MSKSYCKKITDSMLDLSLSFGAKYMQDNNLTYYALKVKLFPRSSEWVFSALPFATIVEDDKEIIIPLSNDHHRSSLGFSAVGACIGTVRAGGKVGLTSVVQMKGKNSGHTVDYIVSRDKDNAFLIRIVACYEGQEEKDEDPQ